MYHEDAQLGELLSDLILQAAQVRRILRKKNLLSLSCSDALLQGVLNRLGSETLLSSAVLTDLGNTAYSIASEQVSKVVARPLLRTSHITPARGRKVL
jgi:hypothetical protein